VPASHLDAPAEPCLIARDVTVRFGGLTALDAVSLQVAPGEIVGVIGPNGAGKTTLFNVLCGFVRPGAGQLTFEGSPLTGHRPHTLAARGIGRTLQGVGLFAGLTARENVMVGAAPLRRAGFASALLGLPYSDRDEQRLAARADEALAAAGCLDVADRLPPSLPFPVQKRVGLARALAAAPRLLLLDEPAGGLGADDLAELAETIRGMRGERAVLLVEHHMDLVMSVCDRVVVLDFGRVIATGTPAQIQADPGVAEAYLGEPVDANTETIGPDQAGHAASVSAGAPS